MTNRQKIQKLTTLAILTAIVIIFQFLGNFIPIPVIETKLCLVLIPIAVGAILIGPKGGAFLGFVCGIIVFLAGVFGMDPFTNFLFSAKPISTAIICIGKGTLAGLCTGLVYRTFKKKNQILAIFLAAAITPIVNTGLFILGGLVLVKDALSSYTGSSAVYFLINFVALKNFPPEFIANIVVAPAINTIVNAVGKKLAK